MKKELISQLITVKKRATETLSVLLERVRAEYHIPADTKMTYAGRLDPMAEGEMLVLTGALCKEKDLYLGRKKEYVVDVLLGASTDTGDMLGIAGSIASSEISEELVRAAVQKIQTIDKLPYPAYSSKTVGGRPLWVSARAGEHVALPEKDVILSDVVLESIETRDLGMLIDATRAGIKEVTGGFRQEEIVSHWENIKKDHGDSGVQLVRIKLTATSGAYMRSLAEWIGGELGVPALAYHINRTKIFE